MSYDAAAGNDRRLVGDALRRRWPTIVAALVVGLLLGVAAGATRPQIYKSTASIIIAPLEGNPYSPDSLAQRSDANTDVATDARLASTPAVAGLVEQALRLQSGSLGWRSRLTVAVVPNSQVITVTYRSSDGTKAKAIAESFGESYLSYRAQRSQQSVSSQLAALDTRGQQVQKSLTAAAGRLDASQSRSDRAFLNQQVATYTEQLAAIAAESARLSSASRNPGQVLTPAGDAVVSGLTPLTYGALGLLGGLLVGLTIAVARQWGDRRLHDAATVEASGVPVLAELRAAERSGGATGALDGEAEQYRVLRTAVAAHAPAPRIIVVSGLSGAAATDELSMRLGDALSRTGHDVTVVLTAPSTRFDWLAGDEQGGGLSDVLLAGLDPYDVRATIAPGLYLMRAGRRIEHASERFITEDMRAALRALAGTADYVVVAAPAAKTSDALALAAAGDRVLLTCQLGVTTIDELAATVRELRRVGGDVMGTVVVGRQRRRAARPAEATRPMGARYAGAPATGGDGDHRAGAPAPVGGAPDGTGLVRRVPPPDGEPPTAR